MKNVKRGTGALRVAEGREPWTVAARRAAGGVVLDEAQFNALKPDDRIRIVSGIFENYEGWVRSIDGDEIEVIPCIFGHAILRFRRADVELPKPDQL
jgi:transcription antitermination factor NusG